LSLVYFDTASYVASETTYITMLPEGWKHYLARPAGCSLQVPVSIFQRKVCGWRAMQHCHVRVVSVALQSAVRGLTPWDWPPVIMRRAAHICRWQLE